MIKYDVIVNYIKICSVYHKICTSTKHRHKLMIFELFKLTNFISIYTKLKNRTYSHGKYNVFLIRIPKYRIIMSENLYDKIVNHLISLYVLEPIIEHKLLEVNVATRKNKGLDKGIFFTKKYLNILKNKKECYILKCDISKYFYNIDHEVLMHQLEKIISDKEIISLIRNIITSTNQDYVNEEINAIKEKEKNIILKNHSSKNAKLQQIKRIDKIPLYNKGKGLPIGNMTSQILAIFYLNDLDHYIKEQLHIKYYIRYMDDFILFHEDRNYLKYCYTKISEKLDELKLKLNDKTEIFKIKNGLNFLGYHFVFKNNKLLLLPTRVMKRKLRRRYRKEGKLIINRYNGYFLRCSCNNFKYKLRFLRKTV